MCCFDHRSWKCFCINYADCFRNVFIENLYSFGKKGTKALKGSCQNASNAAVDQGSQSEYPLACLFLKLLKKTPSKFIRIRVSNLVNYFVTEKHKV